MSTDVNYSDRDGSESKMNRFTSPQEATGATPAPQDTSLTFSCAYCGHGTANPLGVCGPCMVAQSEHYAAPVGLPLHETTGRDALSKALHDERVATNTQRADCWACEAAGSETILDLQKSDSRRDVFAEVSHAMNLVADVWEEDGSDPCRVRISREYANAYRAHAEGYGAPTGSAKFRTDRDASDVPSDVLRRAVLLWAERFQPGDRWDPEDLWDLRAALTGTVEAHPTAHHRRQAANGAALRAPEPTDAP